MLATLLLTNLPKSQVLKIKPSPHQRLSDLRDLLPAIIAQVTPIDFYRVRAKGSLTHQQY